RAFGPISACDGTPGAGGSNICTYVLTNRGPQRCIGMTQLLRTACVVICGIALATSSLAQTPPKSTDDRPIFDVASIKMNNSGTGVDRNRKNNVSLRIENVSLKRIMFM